MVEWIRFSCTSRRRPARPTRRHSLERTVSKRVVVADRSSLEQPDRDRDAFEQRGLDKVDRYGLAAGYRSGG